MHLKSTLFATTIAGLACLPAPVLAWGYQGHFVVAALAWQFLRPQTQKDILALLNKDHDVYTEPDFIHRATWADAYKKDHPETEKWHFVDIPLAQAASLDSAEAAEAPLCPHPTLDGRAGGLHAPSDDCVVDKILQFETELSDPATPTAERILALKYLIHFVGDVHQPFHAIDDNDRGGNCVWIKGGRDGEEPLHSYWDTDVVQAQLKDQDPQVFAAQLRTQISSDQIRNWLSGDPVGWAAESAVLAQKFGYKLGVTALPDCRHENRSKPITLPDGYADTADAVAKIQLQKAGLRLAYMLNEAFAKADAQGAKTGG